MGSGWIWGIIVLPASCLYEIRINIMRCEVTISKWRVDRSSMMVNDRSSYFAQGRRGSVREGPGDALDTEVLEVRSRLDELLGAQVVLPSMCYQRSG